MTVDLVILRRRALFLNSGNHGRLRHFNGGHFGLIGNQPAQEWNQHHQGDADRETTRAELGEKFRVPGIGRGRCGASRFGDHAREISREERREPGHEHPTAHHDSLVLSRREFANHRVSDGRDEQLTNALEHVAREQPHERALAIDAGQLDPYRENEKGDRH